MGIIQRIKALFARRYKGAQKENSIVHRLVRWFKGDYTLKNSELIFSAVSRISNALSAMPVKLYRNAKVEKSDLNDLISCAPNPTLTSCQWFRTMEACRCTYGNAYAIKTFNEANMVGGLEILDPSRVTPILEQDSKELWYRIQAEDGVSFIVHNFYIVHIPFLSTNGYEGINPVSVLLDTLKYNGQIQAFSASQLDKGINAQIVIEAPANLGEQQKLETIKTLTDTWDKTSGNLLLLESGLKASALNLSPVDTKIFEVERIARSRVAMVYNLPPHLLGDYSDTSFSSQEQQTIEFLTLTMTPIVTAYEQELNKKLLTKEQRRRGLHFKFDMNAMLRADSSTRADVYQKAIRGGWMSPNEVRAEYNLAPDPNGGKLLVARDLTTLDNLLSNPDLANVQRQ